jgi:hypothetical protein
MFSNEKTRPFPSPISTRTVERMANLYRAGNEGTCGVVLGESGSRAACGSRFVICLDAMCDTFGERPVGSVAASSFLLPDVCRSTSGPWGSKRP